MNKKPIPPWPNDLTPKTSTHHTEVPVQVKTTVQLRPCNHKPCELCNTCHGHHPQKNQP